MEWELRNLFDDLEVVQEKINDVVTSFVWFDDEYFKYDGNHTLTNNQLKCMAGNITSIVSKTHKLLI